MTTALDVVIPTLNSGASLARTLAALRGADQFALSIIVCDGGSDDDTVGTAHRAGATVVQAPRGRGRQLGAGAHAGSSPWILFLHGDTILGAGWARVAKSFTALPTSVDKAGYFRLRFSSHSPQARRIERLAAWRCRALGLPYGDQGLLISRTLHDSLGGFRPLPLMEDVEFVRRIGAANLVALDADAVTSAARYERGGWLRRPLRNLACLALYFAGVPPDAILRVYGK